MMSLRGPAGEVEYEVLLSTPAVEEKMRAMRDAGRLSELVDPHSFLPALSGDFPTPPRTAWPEPRLGMIYWPVVGLARYAFACLLVDEKTVGALRTEMTEEVSNEVTILLSDDPEDEGEIAREIPMRFLLSRPLVRTGTEDPVLTVGDDVEMDAWVVILVDGRYELLHDTSESGAETWTELFEDNSDVTITDTVEADYLDPNENRWTEERTSGRSLAWRLDIAALSVGSRIVSVPGAAPELQRPTATHATTLATAHATYTADGRDSFGGPVTNEDNGYSYPEEAAVTFGGPTETSPTTVTVSGAGLMRVVSTWADADSAIGSSPRAALAAQWDEDWRDWQTRVMYDTTYAGFVPAVASGYLWDVEWFHDDRVGQTKFYRPPHWYGYLLAPKLAGSGSVETAELCPLLGRIFSTSSNYTASFGSSSVPGDDIIHVDASGGSRTITLPDPSGRYGGSDQFVIKKIDSSGNAVVVDPAIGTIEFTTSVSMSIQGDSVTVYHDGFNWFVM